MMCLTQRIFPVVVMEIGALDCCPGGYVVLRPRRRTHGIESAAANFNDYFLLEAAYDVDFDE